LSKADEAAQQFEHRSAILAAIPGGLQKSGKAGNKRRLGPAAMMPPLSPDELLARLGAMGIVHRTIEHPPVYTVEESRRLRGELPGGHTKNLFLKDKKGRLFLVTARESARIDLKRLHESIGASGRLSFGNAEQLMAALGVEPGSVTSLAVINDEAGLVTMILDEGLMAYDTIYAHPLRNTHTTALSRSDLLRFLRGTGHDPRIVRLPEPPEGLSEV
jgi:Ala-tRNA(Pro) deacylase